MNARRRRGKECPCMYVPPSFLPSFLLSSLESCLARTVKARLGIDEWENKGPVLIGFACQGPPPIGEYKVWIK